MRLFFAGDIPDPQKSAISKIQETLKLSNADVKWVHASSFHITFRFLGEVKKERLQDLKKIGDEVGRLYGSFDVVFKDLGSFPTKGNPHVIWIGIDEGKSQLSMVAQAVESRIARAGFKEEDHGFQPHITLGRVRSAKGLKDLQEKMGMSVPEFQPWRFSGFALKESQQTRTGSVYKDIFVFPLGSK